MAWYDLDIGQYGLNLPDTGGWNPSGFSLGGPSTFDWGDMNLGGPSSALDLGSAAGYPKLDIGDWNSRGAGGGWSPGNLNSWMDVIGKIGSVGKVGLEGWNTINRAGQMADYQDQMKDYLKAQGDYVRQKQAYETDFMKRFGQSQEEFKGANAEFQGQIAGASEQAGAVLGEFMGAAKPLLAQSQELLVPAVEALAKGEVPEHWQPVLEQYKQRARASMVQALISGGMSEEAATAAATPVVDQQAQDMLLKLGAQLTTQGLAVGGQGLTGLQGAGNLAAILGQLAQIGFTPYTQEFNAMAGVLSHILGPANFPMPQAPVA